jgi:hypothetical protein
MFANWFELVHEVHDRTSRALDVEERACEVPCGVVCESAAVKPVNKQGHRGPIRSLEKEYTVCSRLDSVANRPRLVDICNCLLGPNDVYNDLSKYISTYFQRIICLLPPKQALCT